MNRADRRRTNRDLMKGRKTYNLTREQLDQIRKEEQDKAIAVSFNLLLALPIEVLKDHYWPKTYSKKLPEFVDYVIEYYKKWQENELDIDKLKEDLWEYGGVKLVKIGDVDGKKG